MLDKPDELNDRRLARHLVALHYENYEVLIYQSLTFKNLDNLEDTGNLPSYKLILPEHIFCGA